jgi:hypothetical protein
MFNPTPYNVTFRGTDYLGLDMPIIRKLMNGIDPETLVLALFPAGIELGEDGFPATPVRPAFEASPAQRESDGDVFGVRNGADGVKVAEFDEVTVTPYVPAVSKEAVAA